MRRRGAVRIGCLLALVVPVLALLGAMAWYDATSVTVRGVVVRKQETVTLYTKVPMPTDAYVDRTLRLEVEYTPPDSPAIRWGVKASADRYDRTHVGDAVQLRYLRNWPRITVGLAERTAADRLREIPAAVPDGTGTWMLWEIAGFVMLVLCATIGGWPVLVLTVAYVACSVPLFFVDRGPLPVPPEVATAVVGESFRATETPRWGTRTSILDARRLSQPYQSVELTYVPPGPSRDSVRAVDAVDAGSAGALAPGTRVQVRFDRARPREVQLVTATRTFRSRNRFDLWPELLALGCFALAGWWVFRKKLGKQAPVRPGAP